METLIFVASFGLLAAGSFFLVVGAIGLVRMPDVFTRMHAVSVSETLGVAFILGGLMLQAGFTLVTFKLFCLFLLLFLTAPVASHAISRAALADGVKPILHGPEIDAREGDHNPALSEMTKVTTAIDAGEAETSASALVEDAKQEEDEKKS